MVGSFGDLSHLIHGSKPVVFMIIAQVAYAATNVLYKLAFADGMKLGVMIAYRLLFASAFTVPLALILERKTRPKLSWMVLFQAFLCGLFGASLGQGLILKSLALTSATFAASIPNLMPGTTFILAIMFGLEKLRLRTGAGKAKVVGTVIGIGGAMTFTFCKGIKFGIFPTHLNLLHHFQPSHAAEVTPAHKSTSSSHQVLGLFLALGSCLSYSIWLIVQAKMSKTFQAHYTSAALMCVMGSLQALVFAVCTERDLGQWRLGWDIRLLTVAFSGTVTSGLVVILTTICVHEKGPLFASIFTPLSLLMVAIAAALLLDEPLTLGSFIGGLLVAGGLYVVLWGKSKEMKEVASAAKSKVNPADGSTNNNHHQGQLQENFAIDVAFLNAAMANASPENKMDVRESQVDSGNCIVSKIGSLPKETSKLEKD